MVQIYAYCAYVDYDKIINSLSGGEGYEIEGVGTLHGSYLSLSYRVKDIYNNSYTDFCETEARRY